MRSSRSSSPRSQEDREICASTEHITWERTVPLHFKERPQPAPKGRQTLLEKGLLSGWYMEYRLEEELERARRYGRPLAVLHAAPVLLPREQPSGSLLEAGATSAQNIRRVTDLVGWGRDHDLLIIMPETDLAGAEAAASRWQTDLYLKTHPAGAHKWKVRALDGSQLESAEDLFTALRPASQQEAV